MIVKEKFDVFIVYYGDRTNGMEAYTEKLYNSINGCEIYFGKCIKGYFHFITNKHGKNFQVQRELSTAPQCFFL